MTSEEWYGGKWINTKRAARGPFRWDTSIRISHGSGGVIRDAQERIVRGIIITVRSDEGPTIVDRWNEEYATWLMVKPT